MSTMKKSTKSKIPSKDCDITNESEYFENSPKIKKPQKRPNKVVAEDVDLQKLIGTYPNNAKKNKVNEEESSDECKEPRQKMLGVLENQLNARKQNNSKLFKNLHEVVTHLEADHEALEANEQKLEHIAEIMLKCFKQATTAQKQRVKTLKDLYANYKKECEEMEKSHRAETAKIINQLEEDMNNLQQKVISETKRKQMENIHRMIFQFQNDF